MQRDGFKCRNCNDDKSTLHVHHLSYRHRIDPWEYRDEELLTLCEKCHSEEHAIDQKNDSENVTANWLRSIDRILWNGASLKTYRECVAVALHAYVLSGNGTIISMLIKKVSDEFGIHVNDVTGDYAKLVLEHEEYENHKPRFIR